MAKRNLDVLALSVWALASHNLASHIASVLLFNRDAPRVKTPDHARISIWLQLLRWLIFLLCQLLL